uniref:HD domain-containing protein n=2 Tax=Timema TaxID=61471 RepID=A0A7R9AVK9_TIMSH|nr:unnamed protein product [Timema shepardi]CAD7571781.1 unnamed protein product [Timema californicum]
MALVHDLAECIVGDITPFCGVVQSEKHRRETEAMKHIAGLAGNAGEELFDLYKEYESQVTPEAKVVKELDRFDMVLQAFEYEKEQQCPHKLQEFFDSTEGKFTHPILSTLIDELSKQRKEYEEIGLEATSNLSTFST